MVIFDATVTKLGCPLMLDSYTIDMYLESWVRSSYARAMIELQDDVKLKDTLVVDIPKFGGEGYTRSTTRVEYEGKPPRCSTCKVFGHVLYERPKKIFSDILMNLKMPRQFTRGPPLIFVDDDGKPLNKVDSKSINSDSDSDIKVAYDETTQFFASEDANDASLYEDEDYDKYDTYDIGGLRKKELALFDMIDINLRMRSKR
nr:hypothetical protein [Tanacetum cinerariifolium]